MIEPHEHGVAVKVLKIAAATLPIALLLIATCGLVLVGVAWLLGWTSDFRLPLPDG